MKNKKTVAFVIASLIMSFPVPTSAYAYDDVGPLIQDFSVSPSSIDVSTSAQNLTFRFRASDPAGIVYIGVNCGYSRGYPFGQIQIRPERTNGQYVYADGLGDFSPTFFRGNTSDFTIEFVVPVRAGTFPGLVSCRVGGLDGLSNLGPFPSLQDIIIIRDGIGAPTPTPSPTTTPTPTPTPSPILNPTPRPTPTPTPSPIRFPTAPSGNISAPIPRNVTSQIGMQWEGRTARIQIFGNTQLRQIDLRIGGKPNTVFISQGRPLTVTLPDTPPSQTVKLNLINRNGSVKRVTFRHVKFSSLSLIHI